MIFAYLENINIYTFVAQLPLLLVRTWRNMSALGWAYQGMLPVPTGTILMALFTVAVERMVAV
jgi:hypothetical protein